MLDLELTVAYQCRDEQGGSIIPQECKYKPEYHFGLRGGSVEPRPKERAHDREDGGLVRAHHDSAKYHRKDIDGSKGHGSADCPVAESYQGDQESGRHQDLGFS